MTTPPRVKDDAGENASSMRTPPRNLKQNGLLSFGKKVLGGKMSAFKSPTPGGGNQSATKGLGYQPTSASKAEGAALNSGSVVGISHLLFHNNASPISRSLEKRAAAYLQASGGQRLIKNSDQKVRGVDTVPNLLMMFGSVANHQQKADSQQSQ